MFLNNVCKVGYISVIDYLVVYTIFVIHQAIVNLSNTYFIWLSVRNFSKRFVIDFKFSLGIWIFKIHLKFVKLTSKLFKMLEEWIQSPTFLYHSKRICMPLAVSVSDIFVIAYGFIFLICYRCFFLPRQLFINEFVCHIK